MYDDIECRVVQIAHSMTGGEAGGLIKLYRDGIELPTARKIWVDFVIINDKNTPYRVDSLSIHNGIAYDVVITDDKGKLCFYDGYRKRMRQTYYAEKHGLALPADTIELNRIAEEEKKKWEEEAPQREACEKELCEAAYQAHRHNNAMFAKKRMMERWFKDRPDRVESAKRTYNVANLDDISDREWRIMYSEYIESRR